MLQPCDGDIYDSNGPTMLNVPMQYSSKPVDSPLTDSFLLPESLSTRSASLSLVPITPPRVRLRMNRTGKSLLPMLDNVALLPRSRQHSPSALNIEVLYLSPIPVLTMAPNAVPTISVPVFTMVPNILKGCTR